MITIRVHLSHFQKISSLNLELAEVQTGQILDSFFEGDKLISEYFENKYFYWLSNVKVPFKKKKMKFSVLDFYLNFVKKVKCILKSTDIKATPFLVSLA